MLLWAFKVMARDLLSIAAFGFSGENRNRLRWRVKALCRIAGVDVNEVMSTYHYSAEEARNATNNRR